MNGPYLKVRVVFAIIACWVLAAAMPLSCAAQPGSPPTGFTPLFNGKDLSGWHGFETMDPRKFNALSDEEKAAKRARDQQNALEHWRVENGELVNDGQGVFLSTDKDYGDIELLLEYKTVPRADSGIYLRGTPQIQIWDFTEQAKFPLGADKGSGGLWNNSPGRPGKDPLVRADKPFGGWNQFRVIQVGERTTVFLNSQLVVDHAVMENYWDRDLPLIDKGPLQLQTHGGEIRWRNIYLREIPPREADVLLAEPGFKPVFNGENLDGWEGAVQDYQVLDGAILCKPDRGGTLYYHQEYSDFVARLEFKLPPAGNNGLAIRYPGQGDAAYEGMCELQVLDNSSASHASLDDRQYHGSAYGMAAAQRGYLRPVGEWNYQEVTVIGSTIQVVLNGTTILDADLSEVSTYLGDRPHPGKNRASGYFGFAGHNDPVAFRNVRIKALK